MFISGTTCNAELAEPAEKHSSACSAGSALIVLSAERLRFLRRDRDRTAHLAIDQRAVALVVGFGASEIERHQVRDDVLAGGSDRQTPDAGPREGGVEHRPARLQ